MKKQTRCVIGAVLLSLVLCACGVSKDDPEKAPYHEDGLAVAEKNESSEEMKDMDFTVFPNVEISGVDLDALDANELSVLYVQARYCQAMTDADLDTLREIVSEDMIFTHMSGMQQTREEYFADISDGSLNYFTIGIASPVISVDGDRAEITFTSVLNAKAYGARGTFHMKGTHRYEKRDGAWIAVGSPKH